MELGLTSTKTMNTGQKQLLLYKTLLPSRVSVQIYKAEEGGFWAKILELPGCRTQGETLSELIDMMSDAVYSYLGIPSRLRSRLGSYVPVEIIRKIAAKKMRQKTTAHVTLKDILNGQSVPVSSIRSLERV